MDTAFRTSWIIFALALTAAIIGYSSWEGGDIASVRATAEMQTTTSAMAFFFGFPAFHFFSLAVAHAAAYARPQMRVTQFRNVVVIGTALGMAIGHALMIATAFGTQIPLAASISTVVGLAIVACGNYLPKCAREDSLGLSLPWNVLFSVPWNLPLSYLFGVRTWWTLASDHVWNRTHRFASRLWITGGLIYAAAGWFTTGATFINLLGFAWTITTIVPILYSFIIWLGDRQRAHV